MNSQTFWLFIEETMANIPLYRQQLLEEHLGSFSDTKLEQVLVTDPENNLTVVMRSRRTFITITPSTTVHCKTDTAHSETLPHGENYRKCRDAVKMMIASGPS